MKITKIDLKKYEYDFDLCGYFIKNYKVYDSKGNLQIGRKPPLCYPFFISDLNLERSETINDKNGWSSN